MSLITRQTGSSRVKVSAYASRRTSIPLRWIVPPTKRNWNGFVVSSGNGADPGMESSRIDPQGHDVDPVRRHAAGDVAVPDEARVGPDLVDRSVIGPTQDRGRLPNSHG